MEIGVRPSRARRREFLVHGVAEAAGLIHRVHRVAGGHLFPHPPEELRPRPLLRRRDRSGPALHRGDAVVQVHVQAQDVAAALGGLASGRGCGCSRGVMQGCFVVHSPARVPVRPAPRNPSWHLTAPRVTVAAISGLCPSRPIGALSYVRGLFLRSTFAATAPRSAVAELGVVRHKNQFPSTKQNENQEFS